MTPARPCHQPPQCQHNGHMNEAAMETETEGMPGPSNIGTHLTKADVAATAARCLAWH